jgi:adenosylcobyric acid synthase
VTSLEQRERVNAITGETVLRSPRLALVAPPGDELLVMELVGALVRWLRAWHIPVVLYTDAPDDTTETPWSSVRQRPLAGIEGIVGRGVRAETDERAVRNGGDVTLLVSPGDPSAELVLQSAAATETPVVLVLSPGTPAAAVAQYVEDAKALHEGLAFAGYVTVGGAPVAGLGLTLLGGVPRVAAGKPVPAEPEDPIEALDEYRDPAGAEDGWSLDLRALLRIGSRAPAFLRLDVAAAPSTRRPRAARPRASTRRGRALMVQGTHSSAGKSFLATGLARYFSNLGLRVAPFKGQNMSNNSRVVRGGEIGVAQYVQAFAARVEPDVRMNPVLLKPHGIGSHVIMLGQPEPELTPLPWRLRKPLMWPAIRAALHELLDENDVVLIEGAGSPAETSIYHNDVVNMRIAREADAAVVLISDAGQGGSVAQSYGTWRLVPERDRYRIRGFVFNKFYAPGDVSLFLPGCAQLERLTGVPSLGVLPTLEIALPEEDLYSLRGAPTGSGRRVAVLAYPRISNFDEFAPLDHLSEVGIVWAQDAGDLADADVLVLPGSKDVPFDLDWIRRRGLDRAIHDWVESDKPLLGICGGLQMLGETIEDPVGVEGSAEGLGILPLVTMHEAEKVQVRTRSTFEPLEGAWAPLGGLTVDGYEIRFGRTRAIGEIAEVLPNAIGFARGNVLAISLHGIFENQSVIEALFGGSIDSGTLLEDSFEAASAAIATYLDTDRIEEIVLG